MPEKSTTARYALMGHPVAHSLSPKIHNAAFAALQIDAVYELCDSGEAGPRETVRQLIDKGYAGWNVTMPDKMAVASLCDDLSDEARVIGSVNTVLNRDGSLYGTTTDGQGFLYALSTLGITLKGQTMTLLGGGGAAVSMLTAAALAGTQRIAVFCRSTASRDRIDSLARQLRDVSACEIETRPFDDYETMKQLIESSCVLANATNVGMGSSGLSPVPASVLSGGTAVFDAIYHPLETPLLTDAKKAGCQTANGLPMLIGQAAAAFELWTGREMPVNLLPPLI